MWYRQYPVVMQTCIHTYVRMSHALGVVARVCPDVEANPMITLPFVTNDNPTLDTVYSTVESMKHRFDWPRFGQSSGPL